MTDFQPDLSRTGAITRGLADNQTRPGPSQHEDRADPSRLVQDWARRTAPSWGQLSTRGERGYSQMREVGTQRTWRTWPAR